MSPSPWDTKLFKKSGRTTYQFKLLVTKYGWWSTNFLLLFRFWKSNSESFTRVCWIDSNDKECSDTNTSNVPRKVLSYSTDLFEPLLGWRLKDSDRIGISSVYYTSFNRIRIYSFTKNFFKNYKTLSIVPNSLR